MKNEKLYNTAQWAEVRDLVIARDGRKCTVCGSSENLCVHHTYYVRKANPWDYPLHSLLTVCCNCHFDYHCHSEVRVYEGHPQTFDAVYEKRARHQAMLDELDRTEQIREAARLEREQVRRVAGAKVMEVIRSIDWGNITYRDITETMLYHDPACIKLRFEIVVTGQKKKDRRRVDYYPNSSKYFDINTRDHGICDPYQLKEMMLTTSTEIVP